MAIGQIADLTNYALVLILLSLAGQCSTAAHKDFSSNFGEMDSELLLFITINTSGSEY